MRQQSVTAGCLWALILGGALIALIVLSMVR